MKRSHLLAVAAAGALAPRVAAAQGRAPWKIGVTFPLTGPLSSVGIEDLEGAKLAAADLNAQGGMAGHPLQLVVEDSTGTPQGGVAAMRKVVEVDGVQSILTIFTNVVTAQIPLADQLKIPTISTVETPELFAHSVYSFSHATNWSSTMPAAVAYWKGHGVKRVYGLLANSAVGLLMSPALKSAVAGIDAQYSEALFDTNGTDFRGVVERVRDANPDVIVMTGQGTAPEATAIKQLREMGLHAQIWIFGQNYTSKSYHDMIGPYGEGLVFCGLYLDPNVSISNGFARAYRRQMGYLPGYVAGEAYDIIKIFAYGYQKAGYNGEAVRSVVAGLRGLPSVLGGTIAMGPDHYTRFSSAGLWLVKRGKLVRLTA